MEIFFVLFSFVFTLYPVLSSSVSTLDLILSPFVSMLNFIFSWFEPTLTTFPTIPFAYIGQGFSTKTHTIYQIYIGSVMMMVVFQWCLGSLANETCGGFPNNQDAHIPSFFSIAFVFSLLIR